MFTNQLDTTIKSFTNVQTSKNTYNQKYLMNGPKFFDGLLKRLKLENEVGLPASSLATYILLHFKVNDLGLLPTDFVLADLAKENSIPYSTIHNGFHILLERNLVREVFINGIPLYEITDYALNNRTKKEGNLECVSLSYFRIPNKLVETTILKDLVSHRDSKGILFLLELCNSFTRKLGLSTFSEIEENFIIRKMFFLKKRLGKNAKRVREYIQLLAPLFKFEALEEQIKHAREGRITRIRKKINQICIYKFKVQITSQCIIENDNSEIKQQEARMRKEAITRLKTIGYPLSKKDCKDIVVAYKNEISEIAYFIENKLLRKQFMTYAMSFAMDQIENYVKKSNKKLKSVGAIVRSKLREALDSWQSSISDSTRHELLIKYIENNKEVPPCLRIN